MNRSTEVQWSYDNLVQQVKVDTMNIYETLLKYGTGHKELDDPSFADDKIKKPLRLGIYDTDDESLCHEKVVTKCHIPGCTYVAYNLLDYELHYNSLHRYSCAECRKMLPSPHLLDLHIQESHDSFFAVLSEKKPSYCCYVEECKEKFETAEIRKEHCISEHKFPADFRFDQVRQSKKNKKQKSNVKTKGNGMAMDTAPDNEPNTESEEFEKRKKKSFKQHTFGHAKSKAFQSYSGIKFTKSDNAQSNTTKAVNFEDMVVDLKDSLPS